ncbi:ArsR family transcriptional regulator [Alkalibaculum bacchi]|uniref:ArsR family transcriptional regulator n=1 Tax=Alkalibaculum bacchi TaxID=645887 RepID=A0A366I7B1_9FIRM|nr:metalloregulator ArsR/SmtB family transcription factor [Alkalibaculum bacchi]RBP63303.1 ArsR family transcriptional regulator [Alkalibaculum bacchi]
MEEHVKVVAELLKVLANENRLLILCYLIEGPLTVSELSLKITTITQSALSQHLAILKAHKIVDSIKKGQTITYSINDERILSVMEVLKAKYCV